MLSPLLLLFALLISGIGALIVLYAGAYLADHHHLGRFYAYLLGFMAAMLGLVLADDLIAMFVFWELTSVSSFLLIAFQHDKAESRRAALQALLITGGGGLALLAGSALAQAAPGAIAPLTPTPVPQPGGADANERVFVGGLPYYLTEEQCRELLGAFGAILLVPSGSRKVLAGG